MDSQTKAKAFAYVAAFCYFLALCGLLAIPAISYLAPTLYMPYAGWAALGSLFFVAIGQTNAREAAAWREVAARREGQDA